MSKSEIGSFLIAGRWRSIAVKECIDQELAYDAVRCNECHGKVRIVHSRKPHLRHRSLRDAKGCIAGSYFRFPNHPNWSIRKS